MTIPHFADQQNLVFIPALAAGLVATVLICLPIVFAPALRRGRRARRRPLVVSAVVVAAAALVLTGWQAGVGVRALQQQRTDVAAQIRDRYGIDLASGQVGELVDGGAPQVSLPAQAAALGLSGSTHALRLKATVPDDGTYDLVYGGKVLPQPA